MMLGRVIVVLEYLSFINNCAVIEWKHLQIKAVAFWQAAKISKASRAADAPQKRCCGK
jgi:hypothetical protein